MLLLVHEKERLMANEVLGPFTVVAVSKKGQDLQLFCEQVRVPGVAAG